MENVYAAPGRVNLIGEHTDYTGGFVLPIAIPFTTVATIQAVDDSSYHFASVQFAHTHTMSPEDRGPKAGDWSDYPVGVLRQLQMRGINVPPFDLKLSGDVPLGAGLSSSASVEVVTATALLAHAGATLADREIATLCQAAENDFVGSPCGIMDQFVITAAKAGKALLLNTGDLTYELLPMQTGALSNCRVVVVNSMIKHSIGGGAYSDRRTQVEAGQAKLRAMFPEVCNLGHATVAQLEAARATMELVDYKRCRHIVTENARVMEAREAMLAGDAARLGEVMTRAHASERDDFECSTPEIDFLVETANAVPGCFGARLTGGGFGGCTVNLVEASAVEPFKQALLAAYEKKFSHTGEVYVCEAVDGAVERTKHEQSPDAQ